LIIDQTNAGGKRIAKWTATLLFTHSGQTRALSCDLDDGF